MGAVEQADVVVDHRQAIGPQRVRPQFVAERGDAVARLGEPGLRVVVAALAHRDVAMLVERPGDVGLHRRPVVALRLRGDALVVAGVVGGEPLIGLIELDQQVVAEILLDVGERGQPARLGGGVEVRLGEVVKLGDRRLIIGERAGLVALVVDRQPDEMAALGAQQAEFGVAARREAVEQREGLPRLLAHALEIAALPVDLGEQQQRAGALLGDARIDRK